MKKAIIVNILFILVFIFHYFENNFDYDGLNLEMYFSITRVILLILIFIIARRGGVALWLLIPHIFVLYYFEINVVTIFLWSWLAYSK